jgi:hypothetical protein
MKQSEVNHLRLLLGWVRCEIGQSPDELVSTMNEIAGKLDVQIDGGVKQRLVEAHDSARAIPRYVRAAEKALTKMLKDRGEVVEVTVTEQKRIK